VIRISSRSAWLVAALVAAVPAVVQAEVVSRAEAACRPAYGLVVIEGYRRLEALASLET
jgi:hypothetical protein